jgi:hypothetical protein
MSINAFAWNEGVWDQGPEGGLLATGFRVYRALEGPQIVVQWGFPVDIDEVKTLRLVRRERFWSLDEDDGLTLVEVTDFDNGVTYFSDLDFVSRVTGVNDDTLSNSTANYVAGSLVGSDLIPNADLPQFAFPIIANTPTSITVAAGSQLNTLAIAGTTYAIDPSPPDNSIDPDKIYYYTMFTQLLDDSWVAGQSVRGKALALKTGVFEFKLFNLVPPNWRNLDRVPREE